ncbi:acyl-homoserine-lactone synthase [Mesorhizobium sp. CAU 1741]|uniref:acyl-homoserine-lactone synthase n=1 Tax=Mesorhizobium sp. CAU 1741 TaxID=3140366 RepID=UPI00325AB490
MVRIQVITWENRKKHRRILERYFRIRHEIYVDKRQWRAVARPINIEMDAYDNQRAIYLIALDDTGKIVGGSRFGPTLHPHLLADVFPSLARGNPPRAADIVEWTRFFVSPALRVRGRSSPVAGIVLCGVMEVACKIGMRKITVVCESFWPKRLRALGWSVIELGDVLDHPDGDIVALQIDITAEALSSTRKAYGIKEPIAIDMPGPTDAA